MKMRGLKTIFPGKTAGSLLASAVTMAAFPMIAGPGGYGSGSGGGVPGIATNYVIRLQENVKKADEAALRGSQLMADGDYQGAIDQYRAALDLLPDAPMTEPRRRAYIKQFSRASVLLATQRAEEGRYPEAIALVEDVLQPSVDPDNIDAKRLLERLNDPDYYSPALTPSHLERVRRVKLALKTAQGYIDLGDYDRADREFNKALNDDPYNTAARRGMEDNERHKMNYYDAAYDHTRAKMLREVARGWESPVPANLESGPIADIPTDSGTAEIRRTEEKLKTIVLPSVEFADTPLKDALDFLQQRSVELDVNETDVARKGINIILDAGAIPGGGGVAPAAAPAAEGGFGFEGGASPAASGGIGGAGDTRITLRLSNVPLAEALRYTTSLAQLKYKVEPFAVKVVPISTPDADLFTNVYVVPPTFLSTDAGGGGGGGAAAADPFAAAPAAGSSPGAGARRGAKEILESAGITFGSGASAIYNASTSQLIVRNTQDQMELVEAYIESIVQGVEKQIYITSRFVEISEEDNSELGFDWLLGPFNFGSTPRVFGSGGTVGNQTGAGNPLDYSFVNPGTQLPVGINNLTAGLRSGSRAIDGNSIDALIAEAAGTSGSASSMAPAVFGIAGVFTDPQFQVMIRALDQKKGVDLLSAPSVMARSGQRAKVEVIREFIYPTEYDPPEIPNQFGGTTTLGGLGGVSTSGGFPVTPATPTAFETRNTGVTLEVDPVLGADQFTIDLNLAPEVVEFDGFINYGSPILTSSVNALGFVTPVVVTENRIEMPVFNTRKVTTQVTIWDGQTVALGGLIREDIQDVEDKIPILGDLPVAGRLFRSSVELHLKRNLTIFVTAQLMDPAGMPINGRLTDEPLPEPVPRPPITTPAAFAPGPVPYQK